MYKRQIFGCPAEENGAGKTYLAGAGVFDQIDVALTWHPGNMNTVMVGSCLLYTSCIK